MVSKFVAEIDQKSYLFFRKDTHWEMGISKQKQSVCHTAPLRHSETPMVLRLFIDSDNKPFSN